MSRLITLLTLSCTISVIQVSAGNVVCYFSSWAVYRPDNGKFAAENVNPGFCTHLIYAFVGLKEDGSLSVLDDWEFTGLDEVDHLMSLKDNDPNLKLLVSMGGWNEGSSTYSTVSNNPSARSKLVQDVLDFVTKYRFDGFDLDWEYPAQRNGTEADKENYVTLLGELKSALNAKGYILSAAVSGGVKTCEISYDIRGVSDNLDLINIMAYDYHGAFEPFVGHYAPLYASHLDDSEDDKLLNVNTGLQYWLDNGADRQKINLGLGTYGRSFTLSNASDPDLYAPVDGGAVEGPYTRSSGTYGYNEICELYGDWTYVWDDEQQVPHKVSGNQWVGYDDETSIRLKVELANSKEIGGVMVWSLDTDDFRGICGEPYPLLRAIKNNLK